MFQFPVFASLLAVMYGVCRTGCPIRKSPDQRLFAPTRSLSQLITSFFASVSLGIRHTPFLTSFLPCLNILPWGMMLQAVAHTFSCIV